MKIWIVEDSPGPYEPPELVGVVDDPSKVEELYRGWAYGRLAYLKSSRYFNEDKIREMVDKAFLRHMNVTEMEVK